MSRQRGPSYIEDAYDAQYDNSDPEYGSNYDHQLEGCAKISKHIVFFLNFAMLLLGVGLIVITFLSNSSQLSVFGFDPIDDYMKYVIVSFAVLIVIQSFVGCSGATTQTKCILVVYGLLLIVSLCSFIAAAAYLFVSSKNHLNYYSKQQWNELSRDEQIQFQTKHNCFTYKDCQPHIGQRLEKNMTMVGIINIVLMVYQMFMLTVSCLLCTKLKNATYSSPSK